VTGAIVTYVVRCTLPGGVDLELPCATEERALEWMHNFAAANPGIVVTVLGPDGAIARETAPVRQ